jgi:cyclic pyranopterin phosphate synthase
LLGETLGQRPVSAEGLVMKLSHVDEEGRIRMVGVGHKPDTERVAVAKGEVQIAGIMAAKRTHALIPLCHPLPLTKVDVEFKIDEDASRIEITATARCTGKTGVEMEALTAVSVAALTIYDMAKAVEKTMRIGEIRLLRKTGGKSGEWRLEDAE